MKIRFIAIFFTICIVPTLFIGCTAKTKISPIMNHPITTTSPITTTPPIATATPKFDRIIYQGLEKTFVFIKDALMITIKYNDVNNMYSASLVDSSGKEYKSNADPNSIIETGRISFLFTSILKANQKTIDNVTLSFIVANNEVTHMYLNNEDANCQIYDNIDDATALYNISVKQAAFSQKPTEEQWFSVAGNMRGFNYNDTLRNIRSIGSLYSSKNNFVVISGTIVSLNINNANGTYNGIIKGEKGLENYFWTFSYIGNNFPFIKGDRIGVYGVIYSDDTVNSMDSNGRVTNTIQVLNVKIIDYCPGMIENYQLTNFEKSFYLNKTYTNDSGQNISFSLNEINGHALTVLGIRKYGDGQIQISYKYNEVDDSEGMRSEACFLYPSGEIHILNSEHLKDDSIINEGKYFK